MKGFLVFCLLGFLSEIVSAETIAYRQNTTLFVLPDGDGTAVPIGRVTGNYKVGKHMVAFLNGSTLYVASLLSEWQPLYVSDLVQSFHVTPEMVLFRSGKNLYKVTDLSIEHGYKLIADNIRDYETINSKVVIRPEN